MFALSYSQLIIISGDRDTRAIQAKLDALVRVSDAPDELIGAEKA